MSATVEEILALADVEQMLTDTNATSTYGHCHNACTWLIIQIKKACIPDHNIFWCAGTFWDKDHSWLLVQESDPGDADNIIETIIDMTVDQFAPKRTVPFSGPMTDEYEITESISICMGEELINFLEQRG